MIKLIRKFLGLCDHKWQTDQVIECTMQGLYYYTRVQCVCVSVCVKCGKWKTFKIKRKMENF